MPVEDVTTRTHPVEDRMVKARMAQMAVLVAAVLALPAAAPVASSTGAAAPVPVGATTIISSDGGVTGILLELPDGAGIMRGAITMELDEGTTVARAMLRRPDANSSCQLFCFYSNTIIRNSRFNDSGGTGASPDFEIGSGGCDDLNNMPIPCTLGGGVFEFYIASDGPLKAMVEIVGASGEVQVHATGLVDGIYKYLEPECLTALCLQRFGGETREVGGDGRLGFATVVAWESRQGGPVDGLSPSTGFVNACAYPAANSKTSSPDEADHPRGCDEVDTHSSTTPRLVPDVFVNESARLTLTSNFDHVGPQYLGYQVRQANTLGGVKSGAVALWLTEGISCPSGDWAAC